MTEMGKQNEVRQICFKKIRLIFNIESKVIRVLSFSDLSSFVLVEVAEVKLPMMRCSVLGSDLMKSSFTF